MTTGKWTDKELEVLREIYPDTSNPECARVLNRSLRSVKNKVAVLGLKKDPMYLAEVKPGQFRPGQKTWNSGTNWNAGGRSIETQFKPGFKPHTTVPVGTVVETKDGYLKQKVRDDLQPGRLNWKFVHVLEWEKHNGELPKGWIVRFADGDNRNFEPDNLIAVSRQENAVINRWLSVDDMPEGGLYSLVLAARIKMKARERRKEVA